MRALRIIPILAAGCICLSLVFAPRMTAQGPKSTNSDTVARPKKSSDPDKPAPTTGTSADLPPLPSEFKRNPNGGDGNEPFFRVDATAVTVDISVVDPNGNFIPNIPQDHFRITEDNVPQKISNVAIGDAPMTICMVIEFSNLFQKFYSEPWYQTLLAANEFLRTLRKDDYVAIVAYDLRPEILSDFSVDRADAMEAMSRLRMAAYSEAVLYDALTTTAERMQEIEGRKAILLLSSGIDTISHQNYGEARKKLQSAGVPIYSVGLMQAIRNYYETMGYMGNEARMEFMMADNQLRVFSQETGGLAFFPRFYGQFPEIFRTVSEALRKQYVATYTPTNTARDGKFRKLKVELIDPATNKALVLKDPKGKTIKYQIVAKSGYTAPREVE